MGYASTLEDNIEDAQEKYAFRNFNQASSKKASSKKQTKRTSSSQNQQNTDTSSREQERLVSVTDQLISEQIRRLEERKEAKEIKERLEAEIIDLKTKLEAEHNENRHLKRVLELVPEPETDLAFALSNYLEYQKGLREEKQKLTEENRELRRKLAARERNSQQSRKSAAKGSRKKSPRNLG